MPDLGMQGASIRRGLFIINEISDLISGQFNHIAVLQKMLSNRLTVDLGTVGAIQVFQKSAILSNVYYRMFRTDGWVIKDQIIVQRAANRRTFLDEIQLAQGVFTQ